VGNLESRQDHSADKASSLSSSIKIKGMIKTNNRVNYSKSPERQPTALFVASKEGPQAKTLKRGSSDVMLTLKPPAHSSDESGAMTFNERHEDQSPMSSQSHSFEIKGMVKFNNIVTSTPTLLRTTQQQTSVIFAACEERRQAKLVGQKRGFSDAMSSRKHSVEISEESVAALSHKSSNYSSDTARSFNPKILYQKPVGPSTPRDGPISKLWKATQQPAVNERSTWLPSEATCTNTLSLTPDSLKFVHASMPEKRPRRV